MEGYQEELNEICSPSSALIQDQSLVTTVERQQKDLYWAIIDNNIDEVQRLLSEAPIIDILTHFSDSEIEKLEEVSRFKSVKLPFNYGQLERMSIILKVKYCS